MTRNHMTVAAILAAGCLAAPTAMGQPSDRGPIAKDPSSGTQDLRTPDAHDAAEGRPIVASTPVEIVKVQQTAGSGFDWGDAAIGAGGALGIALLGVGGTVAVVRRRHRPTAVAH